MLQHNAEPLTEFIIIPLKRHRPSTQVLGEQSNP